MDDQNSGIYATESEGYGQGNLKVYGAGFSLMTRIESAEALHPCSY